VIELPFQRERPAGMVSAPVSLAQLGAFDAILDARSPSEFAEDRLPGAASAYVLDDAERAQVGTLYKQQSAFEAKRIGAPLVARNIARHFDEQFADKPREWKPLVYCWRGGGRSGALAHVLRQAGWDAMTLEGGYKAFRRQVVTQLEELPARYSYKVILGATGSGKSRLLEALAGAGAQVLDLELIAAHRGSILGDLPDAPQPSQKAFETSLWAALSGFDPARPVFVESESRKVGNLRVPEHLIEKMRAGTCIRVDASPEARVELLMQDYAHLIARPHLLVEKLECLKALHGGEAIERWKALVAGGDWRKLVADLLDNHYDPAYRRSMYRNYAGAQAASAVAVADISRAAFDRLATSIAPRPFAPS
jgi:tRNA 2-selenouridine synthase